MPVTLNSANQLIMEASPGILKHVRVGGIASARSGWQVRRLHDGLMSAPVSPSVAQQATVVIDAGWFGYLKTRWSMVVYVVCVHLSGELVRI